MNGEGTANVTIFFFILLVLGAGVIFLQIFLSKKEKRWPGFILPIISFGISLLALLSVLLFSTLTGTTSLTQNGEIFKRTVQASDVFSMIGAAVYIFVLYNIPTGILLAIYAAYRGKRKRQRDLEKMNIQDLE